jgi:hypothetical protein
LRVVGRRALRSENGQAAVELVAALPFVVLLAAVLWQAALAGQAAWLAGSAARAAARAQAVGGDPAAAARGVLPGRLERGLRVRGRPDGAVTVTVPVPLVAGRGRLTTIDARARFEPQGAGR